jgi:hypothetical protein
MTTTQLRTPVGRLEGLAATELVFAIANDAGRTVVEIDAADPLPAELHPCVPFARVRVTPAQLRELYTLVGRAVGMMQQHEGGKTNG